MAGFDAWNVFVWTFEDFTFCQQAFSMIAVILSKRTGYRKYVKGKWYSKMAAALASLSPHPIHELHG